MVDGPFKSSSIFVFVSACFSSSGDDVDFFIEKHPIVLAVSDVSVRTHAHEGGFDLLHHLLEETPERIDVGLVAEELLPETVIEKERVETLRG